jgi:PAS domain-containing protein
MRAAYRTALEAGEPLDAEYRIVRPDGEVRYVHELSASEFDDDGGHVRCVGTV